MTLIIPYQKQCMKEGGVWVILVTCNNITNVSSPKLSKNISYCHAIYMHFIS